MHTLFISSVGTGVGKTLVTSILCHQLTKSGRAVFAIKPVVSGFLPDDPNSDPALILRSLGRMPSPQGIAEIAPWRFALPASPHLAARSEGRTLALEDVAAFCHECEHQAREVLLIEGAGGIMSPLGETFTVLDLAVSLGSSVVIVTGSYLGAISHTLTALAAIRSRGLHVRAVVVSESLESAGLAETVESLRLFADADLRLYALSRLSGRDDEKWHAAPDLTGLFALGQQ
jgi:dethiobiotin synthetase